MRLVNPRVLAGIRAVAEGALTDTCTVLRPWSGSDGGYRKGGRQTVAENVPCRIREETRRDARGQVVDQEAGATFWEISVPLGTDLRGGDTVVSDGKAYKVAQLFAGNTDRVWISAQLTHIEEKTR